MLIARRARDLARAARAHDRWSCSSAWAFASVFWSSRHHRLALELGLDRGASRSSPSSIGHVRDTLQTARALGDVLRVLLSISLGVEVLSGVLLDMPFRFLGVQGNIAQLGPDPGHLRHPQPARLRRGPRAHHVPDRVPHAVRARRRLGRSRSCSRAASRRSATPPPCWCSPSASGSPSARSRSCATPARSAGRPCSGRSAGSWSSALIVGYAARHPIIALLGAGTDFSMRVNLWNEMVDYLRTRPVQGWGWFGPWNQREFPFNAINLPARRIARDRPERVLRRAPAARLDRARAVRRAAPASRWCARGSTPRERRSVIYAWTPLILVALLVDSMFESFTLSGFGWLLLVLCAVRAGQVAVVARADGARGDDGPVLPHDQDRPERPAG